jgi:hypothetical protein
VFGIAGSVLAGSAGVVGYSFLVVAVVLFATRLSALAGVFTGFGLFWLVMMGWQLASGGELDNLPFWVGVGLVPLVLGLVLTTLAVAHVVRARPKRSAG